jgi:hypothetical protein
MVKNTTNVLIFLALLPFVVAYFLPRTFTITINDEVVATKPMVHEVFRTFRYQSRTSFLFRQDRHCDFRFTGFDGEPGTVLAWESEKPHVGSGEVEITAISPNRIDQEIRFFKPVQSTVYTSCVLRASALNATAITLNYYMKAEFPYNLLVVLFGANKIKADYKVSMKYVKEAVELPKE